MNHEADTPKNEDESDKHIHRWSLLKDREFYELSDLITRYFAAANNTDSTDCTHTDSPLVDAVDTLACIYWQAAPIPDHPLMRSIFIEVMKSIGLNTFYAGMQFVKDGRTLDNNPSSEVREQSEEAKWSEEHASQVREWREGLRRDHYLPEPEISEEDRAVLERVMGGKVPKGLLRRLLPGQREQDDYRPGTYL